MLIEDEANYESMRKASIPYGNSFASKRRADILENEKL